MKTCEEMNQLAALGNVRGIKKLISLGYNVNVQNDDQVYPALIAARRNDLEMLKILIEAGSRLDSADTDGTTPLYWAKHYKNEAMVRLIEEASHRNKDRMAP